jgi:hypothetical protein
MYQSKKMTSVLGLKYD